MPKRLPKVGVGYETFDPKLPFGRGEKEQERTKSISFRVKPDYYHMAEMLRTHPKSPFYGVFDRPEDLERHIYIAGVLALSMQVPIIGEGAPDLILRERTLARIAINAQHRQVLQGSIDNLVGGIGQDIIAGDTDMALSSLDRFLEELLDMEDENWRGEYARRLISAPAFGEIAGKLRKRSAFLKDFEEEYG